MPEPDELARAHSRRLADRIRAEIDSLGSPIPFRRYMELALYEPGLGYYAAAGGAALTQGSDFVTAPAVSPLFARCLARQCAEVLDAMPVEVFRVGTDGVEQRCTTYDGEGNPADCWLRAPECVARAVAAIEADLGRSLPPGYRSEYNPRLHGWFAGLAGSLRRGAVLLVDYGYVRSEYYLPERTMGTLVCTRAHRAHDDPYDWPGLTDISAFVDFTAVTEAATAAGFELEGFSPQAHFLIGCGLEEICREAMGAGDDRVRFEASQQIKRLTLPGEMGERFNAIGFSRGLDVPLSAFAVNDLSSRL